MTEIIDEIFAVFSSGGKKGYANEVNNLAHALQCAWNAEQAGKSPTLITACLLHDFGHMVHDHGPLPINRGIDDCHEVVAERWLSRYFPPAVTEPIRLHVPAKRYLCHVEAGYFESLSTIATRSLALQGGPMTAEEAAAFAKLAYAEDAIVVRRFDDSAKVAGLETPQLAHFRPYLEACLLGVEASPALREAARPEHSV